MTNTDGYFRQFQSKPQMPRAIKFHSGVNLKGGHITIMLSYLYIPCKNYTKLYIVNVSNYIT